MNTQQLSIDVGHITSQLFIRSIADESLTLSLQVLPRIARETVNSRRRIEVEVQLIFGHMQ